MQRPADSPQPGVLASWPRPFQWLVLLAISALFAALLEAAALPAALLIGPMLAGIAAGTSGATVRLPHIPFAGAQAIIGCLIAASIQPEILASFLAGWPLILVAVVTTVGASSFLGWLISHWRILPGTTGVWGSAPGAATAMVLMAEAFGADARLVAFMQYLRVIIVSVTAALIARLWVDTSGVEAPATAWFPVIEWPAFATTLGVALVGAVGGRLLRLPSPYFLGTLILGVTLHFSGLASFQLPEWLLAASYMVIGWTIGLKFTRPVLASAARALPQVLASIVLLIAFCAGLGMLLAYEFDVDPLTAYLATSPGGMDSVAIIAAASTNVNMSFIMALQTARFLFVLLFGPALARLVAKWVRE